MKLIGLALSLSLFVSAASLPALAAAEPPPVVQSAKATVRRVALENAVPCLGWVDTDQKPKGIVLCLHELGMHSGVFEDFGRKMAERGFACYAIDLRGFGSYARKPEKMSIPGSFDDALATLKAIHKAH